MNNTEKANEEITVFVNEFNDYLVQQCKEWCNKYPILEDNNFENVTTDASYGETYAST